MIARWLDAAPEFAALEMEARRILNDAPLKKLPANAALFASGAACEGFALILSGVVRVSTADENGRAITLYRVTRADICIQTVLCMLGGGLYSAEGRTETETHLAFISQTQFDDLLEISRVFRSFVFSRLGKRLGDVTRLLQVVAFASLDARLAHTLLARFDGARRLPVTHQELADEVGASREAVTRRLNLYAREGALRIARGEIEILDAKLLEDRAGGGGV